MCSNRSSGSYKELQDVSGSCLKKQKKDKVRRRGPGVAELEKIRLQQAIKYSTSSLPNIDHTLFTLPPPLPPPPETSLYTTFPIFRPPVLPFSSYFTNMKQHSSSLHPQMMNHSNPSPGQGRFYQFIEPPSNQRSCVDTNVSQYLDEEKKASLIISINSELVLALQILECSLMFFTFHSLSVRGIHGIFSQTPRKLALDQSQGFFILGFLASLLFLMYKNLILICMLRDEKRNQRLDMRLISPVQDSSTTICNPIAIGSYPRHYPNSVSLSLEYEKQEEEAEFDENMQWRSKKPFYSFISSDTQSNGDQEQRPYEQYESDADHGIDLSLKL